ncbi:MAG: hypothetical protein KDB79_12630, partial [Acidobacteria bacterium]|nr:hypothetical protein [Acidobacteriota bacterium]
MLTHIGSPVFTTLTILIFCISARSFQTNSLRVIITDQNSDAVTNPTIRLKRGDSVIKEFKEFAEK